MLVSGNVRVTTVDEHQQVVVVNEPAQGDFFGFAFNRRAHSEIQGPAQKLNLMGDRLADIQERLREGA